MPIIAAAAGIAVAVTIEVTTVAVSIALERAAEAALTKFGSYVWQTARNELSDSKQPAKRGQPPHSHTRQLKKSTRFAFDRRSQSVVIGPTPIGKSGTAPTALEQGGNSRVTIRGQQKNVYVQPHPWMGPALQKESPKLPGLFDNSIQGH